MFSRAGEDWQRVFLGGFLREDRCLLYAGFLCSCLQSRFVVARRGRPAIDNRPFFGFFGCLPGASGREKKTAGSLQLPARSLVCGPRGKLEACCGSTRARR